MKKRVGMRDPNATQAWRADTATGERQVSACRYIAIRATPIMAEPLLYRWADATPLTTQIHGIAGIAPGCHLFGLSARKQF